MEAVYRFLVGPTRVTALKILLVTLLFWDLSGFRSTISPVRLVRSIRLGNPQRTPSEDFLTPSLAGLFVVSNINYSSLCLSFFSLVCASF